ncbi:MAG: hypothetical protein V4507_07130, partial [Verrucomicrobiota bacterium]
CAATILLPLKTTAAHRLALPFLNSECHIAHWVYFFGFPCETKEPPYAKELQIYERSCKPR